MGEYGEYHVPLPGVPFTPGYVNLGDNNKAGPPLASGKLNNGAIATNDTEEVTNAQKLSLELAGKNKKTAVKTEGTRQTWSEWLETATLAAPLRGIHFAANYLSEGLRETAHKVYDFIYYYSFPLFDKNTDESIKLIPRSIRIEIHNNPNLSEDAKSCLLQVITQVPSYQQSTLADPEEKFAEFEKTMKETFENTGAEHQYKKDGARNTPIHIRDSQFEYKSPEVPKDADTTQIASIMENRITTGAQAIENITNRQEDKKWTNVLYLVNNQTNANNLFDDFVQKFNGSVINSTWYENDGEYALLTKLEGHQPTIISTVERDQKGNITKILVEIEGGVPIFQKRLETYQKNVPPKDQMLVSNVITGKLTYTVTLSPEGKPIFSDYKPVTNLREK